MSFVKILKIIITHIITEERSYSRRKTIGNIIRVQVASSFPTIFMQTPGINVYYLVWENDTTLELDAIILYGSVTYNW